MAGRESMTSARRPSNPNSKTWNRPTGPAPTMTASVTVASLVRSGDKCFLQCRGESLLREPFGVKETGLILRPAIAQHGDYRMAGAQLACHTHRRGNIDAARAA